MQAVSPKLRSPLKWHGGKSYLARRILALMPEHQVHVEPFIGGGSVLLNKPPALEEIVGDQDRDLVRFWKALRSYPAAVTLLVSETPYTSDVFGDACYRLNHGLIQDDIDFAVAFLIRNRMSRGGLGKDFAWSDRLRGGQPGDVNAWETNAAALRDVALRIRGVRFLNSPARQVIRDHDGPDTLYYCDPPYVPETRTTKKAYTVEMDREAHTELLDVLNHCQGAVMLSGYANPLYDRELVHWTRHEFDMPNHSGQGKSKQRRKECLWTKEAR